MYPQIFKFIILSLVLACFALLPTAQAVSPAPDGGYAGNNTAEGTSALLSLTSGVNNTALGFEALKADTSGGSNTATGVRALFSNVTGLYNTADGAFALAFNTGDKNTATGFQALYHNTSHENTANGYNALLSNTTGTFNTANGAFALTSNIGGYSNTAMGRSALQGNTGGYDNTATGINALFTNITGYQNTADGSGALFGNITGYKNTAVGFHALLSTTNSHNTAVGCEAMSSNTTGDSDTAVGVQALQSNTTGFWNTAIGSGALEVNTTGKNNTALGVGAGGLSTTGDGNVYVGAGVDGAVGESNHTYIRNIKDTTVSGGGADFVTVDLTTGLLGHNSSSRRYKEEIKPMDDASEALYRLKPVTYRYKKEIDRTQSPAFGLVAEDVAEVNSALVARNAQGQPESVHYEMVNAMLLNEFLKEHRKVREQEATIAQLKSNSAKQEAIIVRQQKGLEALAAHLKEQDSKIQKVSDQVELTKPAPQMATNNH